MNFKLSKNSKNKVVFVGLSGGVDSSVTAALLKKDGYNVVGVFIRTWQPDFIECNFREDRLDAMRIAAHLDIPFLECEATEEYKREVAEYMISEYRVGRTPNPDVLCNREIKFGVFWNFAKENGADFVATGHYAQIQNSILKKAVDPSKDQAYFLYRLTKNDLEHVMFPIGHLKKSEVRKLAEKFALPTASKKDSQGICMLGDLDLKDFLSHFIEPKRGEVLDENGEVVGFHEGAVFLTLGERHGFTITKKTPNDERFYITKKDIEKNTITVGSADFLRSAGENPHDASTSISIENVSWVLIETPDLSKKYSAQVRYHGEFLPCTISSEKDNLKINFEKPILVAPGQSIVLYDNDICLGGGVVK